MKFKDVKNVDRFLDPNRDSAQFQIDLGKLFSNLQSSLLTWVFYIFVEVIQLPRDCFFHSFAQDLLSEEDKWLSLRTIKFLLSVTQQR